MCKAKQRTLEIVVSKRQLSKTRRNCTNSLRKSTACYRKRTPVCPILNSAGSANERENFQSQKMNFGATEPHVIELEEARAERRRRHPARVFDRSQLNDFPAVAIESLATYDAWRENRQMTRNDFMHQQHLTTLPYVDSFITDDARLRTRIGRISVGLPFRVAGLLTKAEFDAAPLAQAGPNTAQKPLKWSPLAAR